MAYVKNGFLSLYDKNVNWRTRTLFMKNFYLLLLCSCYFTFSGCCRRCCKCGEVIEVENNNFYKVTYSNNVEQQRTKLTSLQDFIDNIVPIINTYNKGKPNTLLVKKSIFDPLEIKRVGGFNFGDEADLVNDFRNNTYSRIGLMKDDGRFNYALGCMLGMAIGDSVGAPYEFYPVNKNLYDKNNYTNMYLNSINLAKNPFSDPVSPGQWTDDTSMGLCLADSLIINGGELKPLDVMKRYLAWWYCGYNNASRFAEEKGVSWGIGIIVQNSLKYFLTHPAEQFYTVGGKFSSGNGSMMRNAAIPITFKDMNTAMEIAQKQSYVTHAGIEAAECCKLLTFICLKFINGKKKDNIQSSLEELLNDTSEIYNYLKLDSVKGLAKSQENVRNPRDNSPENWNWKADIFAYNDARFGAQDPEGKYIGGYAMDCMAMALHILYHTTSFKQAITVASKLCGDADTVAAVVGQIAGAFYGFSTFPQKWLDDLYKYDRGEIAIRAFLLNYLADKIIYQ